MGVGVWGWRVEWSAGCWGGGWGVYGLAGRSALLTRGGECELVGGGGCGVAGRVWVWGWCGVAGRGGGWFVVSLCSLSGWVWGVGCLLVFLVGLGGVGRGGAGVVGWRVGGGGWGGGGGSVCLGCCKFISAALTARNWRCGLFVNRIRWTQIRPGNSFTVYSVAVPVVRGVA